MITQNASRYTHGSVAAARRDVEDTLAQMTRVAQLTGQLAGALGGSDTDDWQAVADALTGKTPWEKEDYLLKLLAADRELDELVPRARALIKRYLDPDGIRLLFNMKLDRILDENPVWLLPVRDAWAELVRDMERPVIDLPVTRLPMLEAEAV